MAYIQDYNPTSLSYLSIYEIALFSFKFSDIDFRLGKRINKQWKLCLHTLWTHLACIYADSSFSNELI